MSRIHNFNPGPATLPEPVLERAREELLDYRGRGMSILEMSHRGPEYTEVHRRASSLLRQLLGLPEHYQILFLGGGATLQFSMVPLNLLHQGKSCDFTLTGSWAQKACDDARRVGRVQVVFDGAQDGHASLPDPAGLPLDLEAAYLHLTSNETIGGIQWRDWPDPQGVPMVADMSSDILSRRLPIERFGLIYAGAQKNLGPAGVALVIIRDDLLQSCRKDFPAYLCYRNHAEKDSLYNTPPVFAVYVMTLVLEWLREQGGVAAAEKRAQERAALIYDAIDRSGGFYRSPVATRDRSMMNVVFRLPSAQLEQRFIAAAEGEGLAGLKGHRSVGGCRASMYNAMPLESARVLSGFMRSFAEKCA